VTKAGGGTDRRHSRKPEHLTTPAARHPPRRAAPGCRRKQQTIVAEIKAATADDKISEAEKQRIKDLAVANVKIYLGTNGIRVLAEVLGLSGGALDSFLGSKVEAAVHDLRLTERAVSASTTPVLVGGVESSHDVCRVLMIDDEDEPCDQQSSSSDRRRGSSSAKRNEDGRMPSALRGARAQGLPRRRRFCGPADRPGAEST
jgi:hypothetical protein